MAEAFSFDRVIAPTSLETFLNEHHERRTLIVHRNQPDYYLPLVTIPDLDDFLNERAPLHSEVSLVDARRDIAADEYVRENGRVDVVRLYQFFSEGATIIFQALHERFPALAGLCRAAEQVFTHPFQTNLYFTPPGAQGFKTHHDTHDVFVLQVSGSKRWRVYEPAVELPLPGQTMDDPKHLWGAAIEEFTLHAGDVFYCPRGVPHDADATNEHSLHITFGALTYTWAELMIECMAELSLRDPMFRKALPAGFGTARSNGDTQRIFEQLVQRFAQSASLEPALNALAERFIATRQPMVPGQRSLVSKLDALTPETWVGARPGLIYRWSEQGDTVVLLCHDKEMSLPRHAAAAAAALLETARIQIRDLPGELDEAGKLVLVRRMIREGLATSSVANT